MPKKKRYERRDETVVEDKQSEEGVIRVRIPKEGEILGVVLQMLGAGMLSVKCTDGKIRKVRIPGKYKKRMWCRVGDIVLVSPWYGLQEDRADLVYRYRPNQTNWLVRNGYIPPEFLI